MTASVQVMLLITAIFSTQLSADTSYKIYTLYSRAL